MFYTHVPSNINVNLTWTIGLNINALVSHLSQADRETPHTQ